MNTLLAQAGSKADRLREMHEHFKTPDPQVPYNILVLILAIVVIFVIMRVLNRLQSRRQEQTAVHPVSLYLRVGAKLGLGYIDRYRLWRLAKIAGVANPTSLLISPILFDRAVQQYAGGQLGSVRASAMAAIRGRIFGLDAGIPFELAMAAREDDGSSSAAAAPMA